MLRLVSGYVVAPVMPLLHHTRRRMAGWSLALLPLALFVLFASMTRRIFAGETLSAEFAWVPDLGVSLSFRMDGLGLLFALLVSGIGALVFVYSAGYLEGQRFLGRYYAVLTLFMAAMLGLVTADNLLLLFVFWELTSFSSYLLIAFYSEREAAREAARQALIVTSAGGLAMFAGLLLLGITAGTWTLSEMTAAGGSAREHVRDHALYLPILLLVAAGAFTKSAQFPFHFWLPGAMQAPTPVSAYLHSATMVNAGVYLLARLFPLLGGTGEWQGLLMSAGALTLLLGGFLAWQQTDLKLILAYSTVGALGMMVLLLGIGSAEAMTAAVAFVLVHALYKGALFMVAGAIDHATGTRDIRQLGGLRRAMPYTALAAALAALAMAGIPPSLGFITKELSYGASLHLDAATALRLLLTVILLLGNLFNVTAAALVTLRPFFGARPRGHAPHDLPASLWIGALLLGAGGLILGLFALSLAQPLTEHAANAVMGGTDVIGSADAGEHRTHELALWHGLNTSLLLSLLTLAGGALLYTQVERLRPLGAWADSLTLALNPSRLYRLIIDGVLKAASAYSRAVLNAYLRDYIRIILGTFVLLMGVLLATELDLGDLTDRPGVRFYELVIAFVIIAAAIISTQLNKRLSASAALGTVGYGVTLLYVLYGAPDLAMTQFAIETLTVILFVVVIYRLPKMRKLSSTRARRLDAALAGAVGLTMTLLALAVTSTPLQSRLSPFFAENSLTEAHGHNVVNVILVDFRGFDTMGEITVLSVAAIGVFALLRLTPRKSGNPRESGTESTSSGEEANH